MYGYYHQSMMYGAWPTEDAAEIAANDAGHYSYTVYALRLVNDPRPALVSAGRALSGDAAFLALGQ